LEQIKDADVMRLIERIGEHYKTNISNRYIRPALLQMQLDKTMWDNIEGLTEKFEHYRYEGFHLDELYPQIAATARFIVAARREVAPSLRYRLSDGGSSGPDRVLRDMAVNTFSANLELFAKLVCELYQKVKDVDAAHATNKRPYFEQMPEFNDLDDLILRG